MSVQKGPVSQTGKRAGLKSTVCNAKRSSELQCIYFKTQSLIVRLKVIPWAYYAETILANFWVRVHRRISISGNNKCIYIVLDCYMLAMFLSTYVYAHKKTPPGYT